LLKSSKEDSQNKYTKPSQNPRIALPFTLKAADIPLKEQIVFSVTSTCNLPPSKARRMAPEIDWREIAFRLLLTILAGTLLGMERSKTGHFAGLRTTLLVMLAASVSMIQMNLLIQTNGKPHDSYAVMDVMRLPLGILTGVGFIGGGAILRKGDIIIGLTTAATMWFATVVGLCLGGGQLILGSVSTVIGFFVLWGLRHFETRIEHYQMA
jgi:putative Mg2+ transporter-C (MgtC) family protein